MGNSSKNNQSKNKLSVKRSRVSVLSHVTGGTATALTAVSRVISQVTKGPSAKMTRSAAENADTPAPNNGASASGGGKVVINPVTSIAT